MIILFGGTSGSGKSTLASLMAARLGVTTVISTDSIRNLLRLGGNPCLQRSTYTAGEVVEGMPPDASRKHRVLRGYKLQAQMLQVRRPAILGVTLLHRGNFNLAHGVLGLIGGRRCVRRCGAALRGTAWRGVDWARRGSARLALSRLCWAKLDWVMLGWAWLGLVVPGLGWTWTGMG